MGTLIQLMALPAACMLVAWLRIASADTMAALSRCGTALDIARPTAPRLAHVPPRPLPPTWAPAGSLPRSRQVSRVRSSSLAGGGFE